MKLLNLSYVYDYHPKKENIKSLNEINLNISNSKIMGIVGKNGSGKSTLLQVLNALNLPTSGVFIVDNKEIRNTSKYKEYSFLRKRNALVFQFSDLQFFEKTIEEDFRFTIKQFKLDRDETFLKIKNYLKMFKVDEAKLKQNPLSLSGGEKKRLSIISMLILEPKVLILDEPSIGIDSRFKKELIIILKELKKDGMQIIFSSHDLNFLNELADHIVELDKGKLIFSGEKSEYIFKNYHKNNIPDIYKYANVIGMEFKENLQVNDIVEFIKTNLNEK